MRFRCAEGHEWTTTPRRIRQGNWCELCLNTRKRSPRHGIGKLQEVAKSRGGEKRITSVYTNVDSKYEWRCKQGHVWKSKRLFCLTLGFSRRDVGIWKLLKVGASLPELSSRVDC